MKYLSFLALFSGASLFATLASVGCSSSDEASSTPATTDGGVVRSGAVSLLYGTGRVFGTAEFLEQTSASTAASNCKTSTDGACVISDCVLGSAYDASTSFDVSDSAGTITFTGGSLPSGTALPYSSPSYPTLMTAVASAPWALNDTITVTATGATVPAFETTLSAPAPNPTLTSPVLSESAPVTIDRSTPLGLTWSGAAGGKVVWIVQTSSTSDLVSIKCTFDGASGTATVPSTSLAKLPAGSGTAILTALSTKEITSGDYAIAVGLQGSVANGIGSVTVQ